MMPMISSIGITSHPTHYRFNVPSDTL